MNVYIYIRVYFNIRATYLKLQIIYKNPSCFTSCFNKRMSWKTICISPGHVFEKALLCSSIHCNLLSQAEVPWPAIGSNGGKDGSPDLKESRVSVWSKSRCIILYNIWYDNGILMYGICIIYWYNICIETNIWCMYKYINYIFCNNCVSKNSLVKKKENVTTTNSNHFNTR